MTTDRQTTTPTAGLVGRLNGQHHRSGLTLFLIIVLAHWVEHVAQAVQIWLLGWSLPEARGVLGWYFPWLVREEWLHYGYAIVMLVGLWVLRHGFKGRSRSWWNAALGIQIWHHLEHLLLLVQALTGAYLLGRAAPTSVLQLIVPRVELHLFYNAAVFLPMIVAMYLHVRPRPAELRLMVCHCVRPAVARS